MGARRVRVNAISPGPIATPAALGEVLSFLRNPAAMRPWQRAREPGPDSGKNRW